MVRYRLDELGWLQFEQLSQALLKAELGVDVECWGGRGDYGRDAFCKNALVLLKGTPPSEGPFVFQAKFVVGANAAGSDPFPNLRHAISAECSRIKRRISNGEWSRVAHYVVMTNVPVTADHRTSITQQIQVVLSGVDVHVWGAGDLSATLDNLPGIRVSFPQILGLQDLQELINSVIAKPIRERSTLAIEISTSLARVFVPTKAYSDAIAKLSTYSFVVLTGPPEVGKTTIARMIGLAKLSEGWESYECKAPSDLFQSRRTDANQVFIVDDAFGTTEFKPHRAELWEADLENVFQMLDTKHWLIWTSRGAPLKRALEKLHLQGKARSFPSPGVVEVDVARLTETEKALILYRHAKATTMTEERRQLIKANALAIVRHQHFTPERTRRFIAESLPAVELAIKEGSRPGPAIERAVQSEISTPTTSMRNSFLALEPRYRWFLISMLDADSDKTLHESICKTYERLGGEAYAVDPEATAEILSGHFLRRVHRYVHDGTAATKELPAYDWMHPSWRDLIIDQLASTSIDRQRFLAGCGTDGILLALSGAGGVAGEREFPLLRDVDDWHTVEFRAVELVRNGEADIKELFSGLKDALQRLTKTSVENPKGIGLSSLIGKVLDECRLLWAKSHERISPTLLQGYYTLSLAAMPLRPGPEINCTWESNTSMMQAEIVKPYRDKNYSAIAEWLMLVEILSENEPRLLRQYEFPDQYESDINSLIQSLDHAGREELEPFGSEDEYDTEILCLTEINELLKTAGQFFPTLDRSVSNLLDATLINEDQYRDMKKEQFPAAEREGESEDWKSHEPNVNVQEIFDDL